MSALISLFPSEARRILGVSADSTRTEILAAFRSLASAAHPDHGGSDAAMRDLIAARDLLLARAGHQQQQPRRVRLESAGALEMQAFSDRIKVDLADCYLALPRIQKWGLSLDHPRSAKIARAEANRSIRSEWAGGGVMMPPSDGRQGVIDADSEYAAGGTWLRVDEEKIAERFRSRPESDKKWPMTAIHPAIPAGPLDKLAEKEEAQERVESGLPADAGEAEDLAREALKREALTLRGALKPRDRPILDLYVGQGLKIPQVAEKLGKKPKTVYASVARMGKPMRAAWVRQQWVKAHCFAKGTGDAPVVLYENQQLGWDLDGGAQ